jgi:hypothetical protein
MYLFVVFVSNLAFIAEEYGMRESADHPPTIPHHNLDPPYR